MKLLVDLLSIIKHAGQTLDICAGIVQAVLIDCHLSPEYSIQLHTCCLPHFILNAEDIDI